MLQPNWIKHFSPFENHNVEHTFIFFNLIQAYIVAQSIRLIYSSYCTNKKSIIMPNVLNALTINLYQICIRQQLTTCISHNNFCHETHKFPICWLNNGEVYVVKRDVH
jgi:hypothetical protein